MVFKGKNQFAGVCPGDYISKKRIDHSSDQVTSHACVVCSGVISVSRPLTLEAMSMFEEVILEADISAWEMQQPPVLLPSEPMKCRPSIDPASYLPAPCRCPRCSVASQVALDSTRATEQTTKLPLLLTSEIKMLGGKSTHFSYQVEGQKK